MSGAGRFDVRAPMGALFLLLGAIIAVAGLTSRNAIVAGIPIALAWGGVMMAFGAAMSALAWRAKQ